VDRPNVDDSWSCSEREVDDQRDRHTGDCKYKAGLYETDVHC
jgi:hypothetical protein